MSPEGSPRRTVCDAMVRLCTSTVFVEVDARSVVSLDKDNEVTFVLCELILWVTMPDWVSRIAISVSLLNKRELPLSRVANVVMGCVVS